MTAIPARCRIVRSVVAVPVLALALAACGGSSSGSAAGGSTTSPTTAAGTPGAPSGAQGIGFDFTAIQSCLTAAGISVPTPSGGVNGQPPFGTPTSGAPGSGAPNRTPPSGAPGGGGQLFSDPKVQAALKACGITIPTGAPRPQATSTS